MSDGTDPIQHVEDADGNGSDATSAPPPGVARHVRRIRAWIKWLIVGALALWHWLQDLWHALFGNDSPDPWDF